MCVTLWEPQSPTLDGFKAAPCHEPNSFLWKRQILVMAIKEYSHFGSRVMGR